MEQEMNPGMPPPPPPAPGLPSDPGPSAPAGGLEDLSTPLFEAKGWIKLVGILMIIGGVLSALSCIGIIVAWLPIWMGILLMGAASTAEQAHEQQDRGALAESLGKLKTFFTVMGITTLIVLVLDLVFIVFFFLMAAAGAAASSNMQ